ncbi:MAG: UMP kinase [Clostridia bacterium]|nr:UMP kinase [Clostridia bacterium]
MKFKRVLIKISGEAIAGENGYGINEDVLRSICEGIKEAYKTGVDIAIVIGGGNIWRGKNGKKMDRTTSDHMGMLATIINGLALQAELDDLGVDTRLQTSIEMREIAEQHIRKKAIRHLEKRRVVIFAGGTGNAFFTTDTGAALRAAEINADAILLAKSVDAVYDSDPKLNPDAKRYDEISYEDILNKKLRVMDLTAVSLCMDNKIPIYLFSILEPQNIVRILNGEEIGTKIS